MNIVLRRFRRL
uniref:Uncharacterized protein n=1 Tax=Rhizophora mucronata TaxID=61149 RepID=A0A2P2P8E6_RHIMU